MVGNTFFLDGRLYVVLDNAGRGRFTLPKSFYDNALDVYLPYYVYVKDRVIYIVIERNSPPSSREARIYIPLKVRKNLNLDSNTIFECEKCKDGFILREAKLERIEA